MIQLPSIMKQALPNLAIFSPSPQKKITSKTHRQESQQTSSKDEEQTETSPNNNQQFKPRKSQNSCSTFKIECEEMSIRKFSNPSTTSSSGQFVKNASWPLLRPRWSSDLAMEAPTPNRISFLSTKAELLSIGSEIQSFKSLKIVDYLGLRIQSPLEGHLQSEFLFEKKEQLKENLKRLQSKQGAQKQIQQEQMSRSSQNKEKLQKDENSEKPTNQGYFAPIESKYRQNRCHFITYVQKQCQKLHLSRQTFACCLFLMDEYYKKVRYNSSEFLKLVNCFMIIASKNHQLNILYTCITASNNNIMAEELVGLEVELLKWFQWQVSAFNYIKLVTFYMQNWDHAVEEMGNHKQFKTLDPNLEGYLLYQELCYLADCQVKYNCHINSSIIRQIFKRVFSTKIKNQSHLARLLQKTFTCDLYSIQKQNRYSYQIKSNSEHLLGSLSKWQEEYKQGINRYKQMYEKSVVSKVAYGEFVNLQI